MILKSFNSLNTLIGPFRPVRVVCLLLVTTLISLSAAGQSVSTAHTFTADSLARLLNSRLASIRYEADTAHFTSGICIYDLTADTMLYTYNHTKRMRPASNMKVLTAVTALNNLGSQHTFTTTLAHTGTLATDSVSGKSHLHGNLVVVSDFDPLLTSSHIATMAKAVRDAGITHIHGLIIADISMKDTLSLGNGWCWDDQFTNSAPVLSPLTFDNNQVRTTTPHIHFLNALVKNLRSQGITIIPTPENQPLTSVSPSSVVQPLTTITTISHTLLQVLKPMMKESDNFCAEAVFYHLTPKHPSTAKKSASAIYSLLRNIGADTSTTNCADGSGISLYDYTTPLTLVLALRHAYTTPSVYQPLYTSMPIAGVDGTLVGRMTKTKAHNNVHAKTGTVSGGSCLSGYATASNGHIIAFSIMNNGNRTSSLARQFQDRICVEITK